MRRTLFALLALPACGTPEGGPRDPAAPDLSGLPDGAFLAGLSVKPVGGLVVPLRFDVALAATDDGDPVFDGFEVRAVGDDGGLSDLLVALEEPVPVTVDGGFTIDVPEFVLPAAYTPTGSDVAVDAVLTAASVGAEAFCGDVGGTLPTFGGLPLDGSTFGAGRWVDGAAAAPGSCGDGGPDEIPRIDDCPALVEGRNVGFPSGGEARTFDVALPAGPGPHPLVVAFHGFGGTSADMLESGLLDEAGDAVVIAPQGLDLGDGSSGWDPFSDPRTNVDLAFFDDLLTCARESFDVDDQRIHVTGMSNGGLLTGYLAATRPEVIASVAPMSGGVGIDLVASDATPPALVIWGGESDVAFDQDFDALAHQMIADFRVDGRFVVACDHGLGHTLDASFWPWTFTFFRDHPRGVAPEPYAAGLPTSFPPWCGVDGPRIPGR